MSGSALPDSCGNCMYWMPTMADKGLCRFFPTNIAGKGSYDWCGQHRRVPAPALEPNVDLMPKPPGYPGFPGKKPIKKKAAKKKSKKRVKRA